ncbi:uncharacterized protein BX663DRAFT_557858 [Cokeromyces recurvatus]|uniref:uncharacterized protein n=1 Tax=Cokeromyces recurvatus TaxID=90255 RepID=UPI00221F3170|nr:uncharacterized protein BX663DRAFT_557858 [Cokeromyces recurvatus]KAI7907291.1 hypothetical protein BX663DRAFT_557858 [Cokeromyces recurvatus]
MSEEAKSEQLYKRRRYENNVVWRAKIKEKTMFTCEYKECKKQFDKQYNYKRHLKTHENKESPTIIQANTINKQTPNGEANHNLLPALKVNTTQNQQQPIVHKFTSNAPMNKTVQAISNLINDEQPINDETLIENDDWKEPLIETAKRMKKNITEREEELKKLRAKLRTVEQILASDS